MTHLKFTLVFVHLAIEVCIEEFGVAHCANARYVPPSSLVISNLRSRADSRLYPTWKVWALEYKLFTLRKSLQDYTVSHLQKWTVWNIRCLYGRKSGVPKTSCGSSHLSNFDALRSKRCWWGLLHSNSTVFVRSVAAVDCVQFCLNFQNSMNAAETWALAYSPLHHAACPEYSQDTLCVLTARALFLSCANICIG